MMMKRVLLIAVFISGAARAVSGQTGTADGVAALARGDYQRAVQILKPLAEDWRTENTVAQFFMAGLYESGEGVPVDPLRACALYMRAGSNFESPFGQEAGKLFAPSASRSEEFNLECQTLAIVGFDSGFEPRTFDLAPGHYVDWKLSAATVTYDGRSKRLETPLFGTRGARFLSFEHTELLTGRARALPRHFIEAFVWLPSGKSGPWMLEWYIFEIVRDEIISVEVSELTTERGAAPPPPDSFNPRDYAVLRVDDDGNAEWAVLKGPRQMTQRIETDAERREVREEAAARDAALKSVDWKTPHDVSRQPEMNYTGADGCGNVTVYGWSADRAEAVLVGVDGSALDLSVQSGFDLSRESSRISVKAYVFDKAQRGFDFCSDVHISYGPEAVGPEIWQAVGGVITIELSPPGIRAREPGMRRATVILNELVLRNSAGTTVRIARPVKLTATVGRVFG